MKSLFSSFWFLTVFLGNVIGIAVTKAKVAEKLSNRMFSFAGLNFLAALLFVYLADRYKLTITLSNININQLHFVLLLKPGCPICGPLKVFMRPTVYSNFLVVFSNLHCNWQSNFVPQARFCI